MKVHNGQTDLHRLKNEDKREISYGQIAIRTVKKCRRENS